MEHLGGGGHQIMAATQRKDMDTAALCDALIKILDENDAMPAEESTET